MLLLTDFSAWLFIQGVRQELQTEAYDFTDCLHCCLKEMRLLLMTEEKLVPTFHLPLAAAREKGTVHIPLFLLSSGLTFFIDPVTLLIVVIQPRS